MYNLALVAVIDCRKYLLYYLGSIHFAEVLLLGYLVKQFTAVAKPIKGNDIKEIMN